MCSLFNQLSIKGDFKEIDSNIANFTYQIFKVKDNIDKVEMWFEMERDKDLKNICLAQREVLIAYYKCFLKRLKKLYALKASLGSENKW